MAHGGIIVGDPIQIARTRLIVEQPWFGSLALRLNVEEHDSAWFLARGLHPTAAVDGVDLHFCTEFFEALTLRQRIFVVAHEVMHCALLHMTRRGEREPKLWNVAADFVINLALKDSGFELSPKVLLDERFRDMYVEQVYAILDCERDGGAGQKPQEKIEGILGGFEDIGHVSDAPDPNDQPADPDGNCKPKPTPGDIEIDWKIAVEEATLVAQKAGELPAGIKRFTEKSLQSRADWRDVFRQFVSVTGDYSWTRPNRHQMAEGLYLPGAVKTKLASLIFMVDTSGSIGQKMLNMCAAEAEMVFASEARPDVIHVIYIDAAVQRVDEIVGELEFNPIGGGGTAFQPGFDWIAAEGLTPDAVVFFTDLDCFDKPQDPGYPVLWLVPERCVKTMPFGETVVVPEES